MYSESDSRLRTIIYPASRLHHGGASRHHSDSNDQTHACMEPATPPLTPPISLNQLARIHCRERLFVAPLYWTNRQLELLQCSFGHACPAPPTTTSDFTDERTVARYASGIFTGSQMCDRESSLRMLLTDSDCPFLNRSVPPLSFRSDFFSLCFTEEIFPSTSTGTDEKPLGASRYFPATSPTHPLSPYISTSIRS